eukprot:gene9983-11005_t
MFVPRSVTFSKPKKGTTAKYDEAFQKTKSSGTAEISESKIRPTSSDARTDTGFSISGHEDMNFGTTNVLEEVEDEVSINSDDEEAVKEKSKDQRYPEVGEPVCVVCGRYGEYVCDHTEKDVCSIECKRVNLNRTTVSGRINEQYPGLVNDCEDKVVLRDGPLTRSPSIDKSSFVSSRIDLENNPGVSSKHDQSDGLMTPDEFHTFFNKSFVYKEHPIIVDLQPEKLEFLRERLEIRLKGEEFIPSIIMDFSHCGFHPTLAENLLRNNYVTPTPIQMQTIPVALCGKDLIACAQTGSGKSASFLLPVIQRVSAATGIFEEYSLKCGFPLALILCPTRELCMQLEDQAKVFCKGLRNLRTALIIGGNPLPQQLHRLKQGVQIIIATPGRLLDVLAKHDAGCNLSYVQILVLDEVDTMLQLGFQSQIDQILERSPHSSQRMMFSATIPPAIERIASNLLKNPIFVSVGEPCLPNKSVKQIILWVEEATKKKRLFDVITDKRHFCPPAIVFVDSKIGADMLAEATSKVCGVSCASLHGDKVQSERTRILDEFLNGSYDVLVSTSLLGRGIDLLNVKMVINFDMPSSIEEYVHQVGRARKLDAKGFAITFINNGNKELFLRLTETLGDSAQVKIPAEVLNSPYLQQQKERRKRKRGSGVKGMGRSELVTTGNLMDMLKEYLTKRKK